MLDPQSALRREPYTMYIDGKFEVSDSGKTFDVVSPVTNKVIAKVYEGGRSDVERAISSARRAFDDGPWSRMSQAERSSLLLRAGQLLKEREDEFIAIEGLNCGKLFASLKYYELPSSTDAFQFAAGKARCLDGKVVPVDGGGHYLNYVMWQPCGVVAEILPWNGPLMMGCQKVSMILAAGNSVVIKPPTWAPLSMLELASVFHEAGFPEGVVNVIPGPGSTVGDALVRNPLVDMVSLTGGTETGKQILASAAGTVKDVALELGGKSPNIVFDDVDISTTAKWAFFGFTLNSGQVCVAGTRLILHEAIYDEFINELVNLCNQVVPGDGFAPGVNFGPMISRAHYESVWRHIQQGIAEGARLVTGGFRYTDPAVAAGNFIPPTIFADVTPEMSIFQQEIFGPVLCVTKFSTEQEAIRLANAVDYGLAGGVFTSDARRAQRVAEKIRAGQIYVNTYYSKGIMESPGVGWKASGVGGAGITKYMRPKTVFVELEDGTVPPM
ncbi:MAG: NAD/NADP-dependent betaine aldehyde dehydrogenase [Firmicutes bacterium ADurb.BinA052]|nr:MAG: NAD/NADP-dependent betaine aldehyde dehydrogenase [Firmicutes bacterium ADurb.BinA052]